MALPKIDSPIFNAELPSGLTVQYRPFRVKEEKLLLMAQEDKENTDNMVQAVRQVIGNCVIDEGVEIEKLPSFDLEYLYAAIRCRSVGEEVEIYYKHVDGKNLSGQDCDHTQAVKVNLEDIEVIKDPNHTNTVKLNDQYGVRLRYPTIEMIQKVNTVDAYQAILDLVVQCIDCVYSEDEMFEPDTIEEARDFLDTLSKEHVEGMQTFFETMPKNVINIKYKCEKCGEEEEFKIEGLADFF